MYPRLGKMIVRVRIHHIGYENLIKPSGNLQSPVTGIALQHEPMSRILHVFQQSIDCNVEFGDVRFRNFGTSAKSKDLE
jgi:hypothetical protein